MLLKGGVCWLPKWMMANKWTRGEKPKINLSNQQPPPPIPPEDKGDHPDSSQPPCIIHWTVFLLAYFLFIPTSLSCSPPILPLASSINLIQSYCRVYGGKNPLNEVTFSKMTLIYKMLVYLEIILIYHTVIKISRIKEMLFKY